MVPLDSRTMKRRTPHLVPQGIGDLQTLLERNRSPRMLSPPAAPGVG
jgi:hypothetical protein